MIRQAEYQHVTTLIDYMREVPYDVNRETLYTAQELYEGYDPHDQTSYASCYDQRVYAHYLSLGKQTTRMEESMARTLHDHAIHSAMERFFATHDSRRCVGIMGGHALLRTDRMYREIVLLSKRLTEKGCYMLSGGGPGAMEATHLGAWLAGQDETAVDDALAMLAPAPSFREAGWMSTAFSVLEKYPQTTYHSLSIPTWLYGHEPSTVFATHIAKLFENSLREDRLLTLSYGGIVYTPGSAGTIQEIFQEAVQNHYLSFGFSSPMIFLGEDFWTKELPIYPLLQQLANTGMYKNLLLTLTDDIGTVAEELINYQLHA